VLLPINPSTSIRPSPPRPGQRQRKAPVVRAGHFRPPNLNASPPFVGGFPESGAPSLQSFFGLTSLITEVPVDPGIAVGAVYLIVEGHFSLFLRLAHSATSSGDGFRFARPGTTRFGYVFQAYSGLPFSDNLFERSSPDPLNNILPEYHPAVVSAKHNAPLSLGVGGVNSSARIVECNLIFRYEGDIGLNSPSVQFGASVAQDRLRANREIGRRGWQCLSPRKALTS